jgi:CRISPR-associated endonuclease/helicase Cas3
MVGKNKTGAYAHSRPDRSCDEWQSLSEHLGNTADQAEAFAAFFGGTSWARLAGLWHDLGKYAPDWQDFLRSAGEDESHRGHGPDHSTAGAIHSLDRFGGPGRILAYLIAGHHAGLADWLSAGEGNRALSQRLLHRDHLGRTFADAPPAAIRDASSPTDGPPSRAADPAFWIRMLFSCLVDADYLDTERFMDPARAEERGRYPDLASLWPLYEFFMNDKMATAPPTSVNGIRREILERCLSVASHEPGLFTLTVPTGGGKTLASTGFALKHALVHGKRRIIYVIPYTSIIEQTADILRSVFGEAVIEHHSNLDASDPERDTTRHRLAAENWDAPVVVTTNVQFFESLFAARPSRCRKLHRIVESVVILDEVQLLPREFIEPILHAVRELRRHYGVTLVLSTATQPAFAPFSSPDHRFPGLEGSVEIMEHPLELHERLRRVEVIVPPDLTTPVAWDMLADELCRHESVLCITHRRDDCRELHRRLPSGAYHLSALMCGAHRSEVIARIKADLDAGRPTRVISTQLVEAGVDLDFPVVYRALAGLDSIAQAAGRCNREGNLARGEVRLFVPPSRPPEALAAPAEIARRLLARDGGDPLRPDGFHDFFRELFWLAGPDLDRHRVLSDLADGAPPGDRFWFKFRTAAGKFRLIDDRGSRTVLVRYGKGADLIAQLERNGPDAWLLRRLQRYAVNLPDRRVSMLMACGEILELPVAPGILIQSSSGGYDPVTGFSGADERTAYNPDDLII